MKNSRIIESNKVFAVDIGHIRCDGTVNMTIRMQDGSEVELYSLTQKQANSVEYNLTHPDMSIKFDTRFLNQTEDQWLSQNGIFNYNRKEA